MRLSVFKVLAIICLCSESYAQNVNIDKCGIGVTPIGDATTYVRTHPSSSSRNTVYYVPWSYKGSFKIGGGSQYSCGGSNMYFYNCVINPPGSAIYSQFTDAVPVIWSGGAKLEEGFDELYGCPPPHFGSPCFREQSSFPPKPDHSVESVGNYYPYIKVPKPDGTTTYDLRWEHTVINGDGSENVFKFESNSHTFIAGTEPTVEQYHSIKDNSQFSSERLISNDIAFQVCADGATATRFKIKFDGEDPYKGWTIRIRDPSNNSFQPLGSLNSLTPSRVDEAIFEYTHPEYIVGSAKQYNLILELIDHYYHENVVKTYPLIVHRAPVLMVHGLWSNSSTFDEMILGLTDIYDPGLLFRMDYEITNYFPISFNLPQVPLEVRDAINTLVNKGISAGKVDYIGHSMGGLLGRLYLKNHEKEYNNDIRRFITINTPHLGSHWADIFSDNDSLPPFQACGLFWIWMSNLTCNNRVLQDLRTDSYTINELINGHSPDAKNVPSHAICSWTDDVIIDVIRNGMFFYTNPKIFLKQIELYLATYNLFGGEKNDLIVSLPSQQGGISSNAYTVIPNAWHSSSLSNQAVIQTVKDLLTAQSTSRFSQFTNIKNNARLAAPTEEANINSTSSSGSIQINSPIKGSKIPGGTTYSVEVTGRGLSEIFSVMTHSSDSVFVALSEGSSFVTSVSDDQKFRGRRNMIVIGKALDGSIVTDTTHFFLGENGDALPLKLLDFRGRKVENAGRLDWSVTDMHHFSHFEVERSGDGVRFERYGYIVSGESYPEKSSFSFLDTRPLSGVNYYRLKMVDLDGAFSYSGFVSIGFDGVGGDPVVYPNPATSMLYFSDSGRLSGVSVVDVVGRVVLSTDNPRELENGFPVIGLSGAYVIVLKYGSGKVVTRTIVINGR